MDPKMPAWIARPPNNLDDDARQVWLLLVPKLWRRGILTKKDLIALEMYCSTLGQLRKYQAKNQGSPAEIDLLHDLETETDRWAKEFFIPPGQYEILPDDETLIYYQVLGDIDKAWLEKMNMAIVVYIGALRLIQQGSENFIPVAQEAAAAIHELLECYRIEMDG